MKKSYYLFAFDKPIEKCSDCPMLDPSGFGFWCNLLHEKTVINAPNPKCPLVPIKGKVEQN